MELKIFDEGFRDNTNNWWTGKSESGRCDFVEGRYILEQITETGDYATWRLIPLVESKAYSFEASFTFLGGSTNNGFGFLWGQESNNGTENRYAGFHYFIISASGKYVIRSYNPQTKKAEPIKDWTDSAFINLGENTSNVLKIMKFDDSIDKQLYFLINEQMILKTNYLPLFGYETGFIAFQNMKVAINHFRATYYFDESNQ